MSATLTERTTRPIGSALQVRLSAMPEKSEGGIYLPETMREQWTDAEVIKAGPGRWYKDERGRGYPWTIVPMWAQVGDRVLFQRHHLRMIDLRTKQGVVHDEDLLGLVDADGEVTPLNDWCLLELPPRRTETASGLALPEWQQKRPNYGTLLRVGPGRLREKGRFVGTRQTCEELMGFPRGPERFLVCAGDLVDRVYHFGEHAEVLDVGRTEAERWLVRAGDLVAWEDVP